ncbi:MAG: hypothetical protein ACLR0U_18210 [Enterocloster clostridioformis]
MEQVTSGTVEGMMQMGAANWEPYNSEVNVAPLPFLFTSLDNARMPGPVSSASSSAKSSWSQQA